MNSSEKFPTPGQSEEQPGVEVPKRPGDLKKRREGREAGKHGRGYYKFEERETEEERQKEILRLELRIAILQKRAKIKKTKELLEKIAELRRKIEELKQTL